MLKQRRQIKHIVERQTDEIYKNIFNIQLRDADTCENLNDLQLKYTVKI